MPTNGRNLASGTGVPLLNAPSQREESERDLRISPLPVSDILFHAAPFLCWLMDRKHESRSVCIMGIPHSTVHAISVVFDDAKAT